MPGGPRSSRIVWFAVALTALSQPTRIEAGPPLITDDPGTPGAGRWEINVAFMMVRADDVSAAAVPLLDVNYGVGDRGQFKYEVPWVFVDEPGEDTKNGLGNSVVGFKYRFLQKDEDGLAMSVYPQLEFNNPTSSDERGIVDEGGQLFVPVQISQPLGRFTLFGEFGYSWIEAGEDLWVLRVAMGRPLTPRLELLAEIADAAGVRLDDHELVSNVGVVWRISDRVNFLGSVGRTIHELRGSESAMLAYAAAQLSF